MHVRALGLLPRGTLKTRHTPILSNRMPDFRGVTTLSFQVAIPYVFDAVVPYGSRTECGHVYMTHGDHFMTFRHTLIWANNRHRECTLAPYGDMAVEQHGGL